MWCKSCRQDVPGIASLDEGAFHCARCGARVRRRRLSTVQSPLSQGICDQGIDLSGDVNLEPDPTEALHQWAEDEQLENARRLLRPVATGEAPKGMQPANQERQIRFDPPGSQNLRVPLPEAALHALASVGHSGITPFHMAPQRVAATYVAPPQRPAGRGAFTAFAWFIVSLGLMGLVCGGVLAGWSLATNRPELWKFGLPTALGGFGLMVFGLFLALLAKLLANSRESKPASAGHLPVGYTVPHYAAPGTGNVSPAVIDELRGQLDRLTAQISVANSKARQGW